MFGNQQAARRNKRSVDSRSPFTTFCPKSARFRSLEVEFCKKGAPGAKMRLRKHFSKTTKRFSGTAQHFSKTAKRFSALPKHFSTLSKRFSALPKRFSALSKRFYTMFRS